ncbi:hypothetical protein ACA910_007111 [Epithemia clementina (nom. ined.)]
MTGQPSLHNSNSANAMESEAVQNSSGERYASTYRDIDFSLKDLYLDPDHVAQEHPSRALQGGEGGEYDRGHCLQDGDAKQTDSVLYTSSASFSSVAPSSSWNSAKEHSSGKQFYHSTAVAPHALLATGGNHVSTIPTQMRSTPPNSGLTTQGGMGGRTMDASTLYDEKSDSLIPSIQVPSTQVGARTATPLQYEFDAQEPPPLALSRYKRPKLCQGRNIEKIFPKYKHFVCGAWDGFRLLRHHNEFVKLIADALMPSMQEICASFNPGKGVKRKYLNMVVEELRNQADFKIWTALKKEEQPCSGFAKDSGDDHDFDGKQEQTTSKKRKKELSIATAETEHGINDDIHRKLPAATSSPPSTIISTNKDKRTNNHVHRFGAKEFPNEWFLDITDGDYLRDDLEAHVHKTYEDYLHNRLESPIRTFLSNTFTTEENGILPGQQDQQEGPNHEGPNRQELQHQAKHRIQLDNRVQIDYEKHGNHNYEDWAKTIYITLRDNYLDERAHAIDELRRHLLNDWLYKLVKEWAKFDYCDHFAVVMENVLEHRVEEVLRVCLVLDRAQALYNMQPIRGMSPHGADWFCSWHVEQPTTADGFNNLLKWTTKQSKIKFWQDVQQDWRRVYPNLQPLMNKKLYRLIFHPLLRLHQDEQLRKWAEPAESPTRPPSFCLISYPTE